MNKKITESRNSKSTELDTLSITEIITLINDEDSKVSTVIKELIPIISKLINKIVLNIKKGGRLIYVGSGTSGRLGVLDASECPPTFSTDPNLVIGIIAGNKKALWKSVEGAEDDLTLAENDVKKHNITNLDSVIGISASGSTPYVHQFLKKAKKNGAFTSILTSNKINKKKYIDSKIEFIVGPEIITGSTRMKAGTATKMILNMISTTTMIMLNKTYKNYMVDLKISNNKLINRGVNIIKTITNLNTKESEILLKKANGKVKVAILMHLTSEPYSNAKRNLEKNKGNLRQALKKTL